jgi:tRNA-Thr(GGU) m(6)t(6)A37 methyltransferase TsaA
METIVLTPIGYVQNARQVLADDEWGEVVSTVELVDSLPAEALDGIETFSHVEVIFYFHRVEENSIVTAARHPRNNPAWPRVGIFAQRGKNRPNRLGATVARVVRRDGRTLLLAGLDAVDGTPVLDIKPVMREFLPREPVVQPEWATALMENYWGQGDG